MANAGKRKHGTLTLEVKMDILKKLDSGSSPSDVARQFKIPRTTVNSIRAKKEAITKVMLNADSSVSSRKTVRSGEYSLMEEALYSWFLNERKNRNSPITADILKAKAVFFYQRLYKKDDFRASEGWFNKFKVRYGIRQLTVSGERLSSDESAVLPYVGKFQDYVKEHGLTPHQVYNADETGLFYRLLPNKTYVYREERAAPGRKVSKDRVTIMPCSNASGTHKLPLLLIGKSKKPRAFKNVNLPLTYRNQSKAWMTGALFVEWFHEEFVPEVRRFLRSRNLSPKAVLVVDNAPGHGKDELASSDGLIRVLFMPPNCTPLLQPMDQNLIQNVKTNFKKKILLRVVSQTSDISLALKDLNLKDVAFTVAEAWNAVLPKVIIASWEKLWPQLGISAEDDASAWEPEDDIPFAELVTTAVGQHPDSGLTRQDIEEWCNEADYQNLSDEDFLEEFEADHSRTAIDEDDENHPLPKPIATIKSDDALAAIEKCILWGEENSESASTLTTLAKLRQNILVKIYQGKKQSRIDDFF